MIRHAKIYQTEKTWWERQPLVMVAAAASEHIARQSTNEKTRFGCRSCRRWRGRKTRAGKIRSTYSSSLSSSIISCSIAMEPLYALEIHLPRHQPLVERLRGSMTRIILLHRPDSLVSSSQTQAVAKYILWCHWSFQFGSPEESSPH